MGNGRRKLLKTREKNIQYVGRLGVEGNRGGGVRLKGYTVPDRRCAKRGGSRGPKERGGKADLKTQQTS